MWKHHLDRLLEPKFKSLLITHSIMYEYRKLNFKTFVYIKGDPLTLQESLLYVPSFCVLLIPRWW